jgi:hypothetical protein
VLRCVDVQEIYPTYSLFLNDTLELFDMMLPYHQKIKLVSGDIHQFVLGDICHSSGACIPQMVASGITKGTTAPLASSLPHFSASTLADVGITDASQVRR